MTRALACALLLLVACHSPEEDGDYPPDATPYEPPVEDPVTRAEVSAACEAYSVASCEKVGTCSSSGQTWLNDCLEDSRTDCASKINAGDSCWSGMFHGFNRCVEELAMETCADVCSDSFCSHRCFYFCPTSGEAEKSVSR